MIIIRRTKAHPHMLNKRGYFKYLRKDFIGALRDFNEAIRLAPHYSTAHHNRGFALLALSESTEDPFGLIFNEGLKALRKSSTLPFSGSDYAI